MVSTKADFEAWEKSKVEQGLQQGVHQTIEAIYKGRFGAMPKEQREFLYKLGDVAILTKLALTVATGSTVEIEKSLRSA